MDFVYVLGLHTPDMDIIGVFLVLDVLYIQHASAHGYLAMLEILMMCFTECLLFNMFNMFKHKIHVFVTIVFFVICLIVSQLELCFV